MLARRCSGTRAHALWLTLAAISVAAATLPASATAATIDVGYHGDENNGFMHGCALREAIRSANENAPIGNCDAGELGRDKIRVEAGDHELTVPGLEEFADAGDLDITEDVTVIGRGDGFTLDAGGEDGIDDRAFDIRGTATATIKNAVIRRGHTVGGADGAAIRVAEDATLKLLGSVLRKNHADDAGRSGAIESAGTIELTNSTVVGNRAAFVGAIAAQGQTTLKRSNVVNNQGAFNGGAIISEGDLRILDSTISENDLVGETGEHEGGGLTVFLGTALLRNVTVSGNQADQGGGGIAIYNGTLRLVHTTVTNNTADANAGGANPADGGGIHRIGGTLELRSSVIANNHDNSPGVPIHPDCSGAVTSLGYNLIRNQTGCTVGGAPADPDVAAGANPKLKPLADNGGPTRTHALRATSPLVDLIPAADCTDGDAIDPKPVRKDQRGVRRPQGGRCDGGSYERR